MIYFIICAFLFFGMFFVSADVLKLPSGKTVRAFEKLKKRIAAGKKSRIDIKVELFAVKLSKRIRLSRYGKEELEDILKSADIDYTPERFISNCAVKASLVAILAIPAGFVFPAVVPAVLILAVILFEVMRQRPFAIASKKREEIETELPAFVSHTAKILKHTRDVLYIVSSYTEFAGRTFAKELLVTEADMRSGNYENALSRLESRVGSSMLSDVTRGLIGIIRGDDTDIYWKNLELKFADYQKQLLRQKAQRVPGKVKRLSMSLLVCFMLIYLVVMGTVILSNITVFF